MNQREQLEALRLQQGADRAGMKSVLGSSGFSKIDLEGATFLEAHRPAENNLDGFESEIAQLRALNPCIKVAGHAAAGHIDVCRH
jgi:hypothetical protein